MQAPLPLADELVVDLFAGGGGASTGIEAGIGRAVDIAVNHDPQAVAMHQQNHPHTKHFCESVFAVPCVAVTGNQPVGLLWASPDCTHHSKAKGGKPVSNKRRGLAWVVIRWARRCRPRVIMLENVEEFADWGPLTADDKPCAARKGQTYKRWVAQLERCGYVVESRVLKACDYGAPTIRKRLFVIARCDGLPITWPQPSHGAPGDKAVKRGRLAPYRTAAQCIDWSIPCPSIFERKRPLAANTLARIARGVHRYVVTNADPFIVKFRAQSTGHSVHEPVHTITAGGEQKRPGTGNAMALCVPTLVQTGYGERPSGWRCESCGHRYDRADLPTCGCSHCGSTDDPVLIAGQQPRALDIQQPLGTIVAGGGKHALVAAFMAKHYGGNYTGPGSAIGEPLHTVTTSDHNAVVAASLLNMKGKSPEGAMPIDEPGPTVCAGATHAHLVAALMAPYYSNGSGKTGRAVDVPAPAITTKDRLQLVTVTIHGTTYVITDIGMRMLQPRELFRAQGFPDDYVIEFEHNGKPLPKYAQVRMCGNSVAPVIPEALVRANFAHEISYRSAA